VNFLNGILAFGAAAFVVPLIIHILNRSRFRSIQWGAMHLLDSIVRVNYRRFRIEQLILLLVRCAIPAVLAFCLARPLLTGWRDLAGEAPVSAVILLDTSYSMDASTGGGRHFDQAIQEAIAILENMSRGSEVSVIQTGGRPTPVFDQPVFDPLLMIERLRELQGGYGASQMPESLELAMATLSSMSHVRRELIVISDFQSSDWPEKSDPFYKQIKKTVEDAEIQPVTSLIHVGSECFGNVSVDGIEVSSGAVGVGQDVLVRVRIENHGSSEYEKARVALLLDGVEDSVSQVDLDPQGTTQAVFTCQFETPGSHVITAELAVDDPLSSDNRLSAAINVWNKIDVLLVDGAPSAQPLQGETDFLSVALTPFTLGRFRLTDLVLTKTIHPPLLKSDVLKGVRVVVLANVEKLEPQQVIDLNQYVRSGGSLLLFAGDKLDVNWYNESLFADNAGLLPAPFSSTVGVGNAGAGGVVTPGDLSVANAARIVAQHFDHPALELFNDPANGDLSTAEIRRWFRVGDVPDETNVLARLSSGDPLMLEKEVGDGLVVQVATACDADWSDLPLRPVFVPLMQQLVASLASRVAPPQNIATGEPVISVFGGEFGDAPLSLTTPAGERRTIQLQDLEGRAVARFVDTQRPGIYTLTGPEAEAIHYVAQSSRDESKLEILEDDDIRDVAEPLLATTVTSAKEYLRRDRNWRHGREVWKFLLALVLLLMFTELFLQQRFARDRA
jgi:hypothetical protein